MKVTLSDTEIPDGIADPLSSSVLSRRVRNAAFFFAGALVYWALFSFVSYFSGENIIRLTPFFVGAAGYFSGFRTGTACALIAIVIHTSVFNDLGHDGVLAAFGVNPAAHIGILLIGTLTGRLRSVTRALRADIARLEEKKSESGDADQQLTVVAPRENEPERLHKHLQKDLKIVTVKKEDAAAVNPATKEVFQGPSDTNETVLVAEDDTAVCQIVQNVLESKGYRIFLAGDGEAALETAADHGGEIHLLITDMVMPGMNGRDLAAKLRSIHPRLKVLYISGYIGSASVKITELGPDTSFLSKPFSPESLARKIRLLLDTSPPKPAHRPSDTHDQPTPPYPSVSLQ